MITTVQVLLTLQTVVILVFQLMVCVGASSGGHMQFLSKLNISSFTEVKQEEENLYMHVKQILQ
jgi:hypothetical protein